MNSILLTCKNEDQCQALEEWWKRSGRMHLNSEMEKKILQGEIDYKDWLEVEVIVLDGKRPPLPFYAYYDAVDTPRGSGIVLDMWYERRKRGGISMASCWTYLIELAGCDTVIECDEKDMGLHKRGKNK